MLAAGRADGVLLSVLILYPLHFADRGIALTVAADVLAAVSLIVFWFSGRHRATAWWVLCVLSAVQACRFGELYDQLQPSWASVSAACALGGVLYCVTWLLPRLQVRRGRQTRAP
jgi:hypothetical protein